MHKFKIKIKSVNGNFEVKKLLTIEIYTPYPFILVGSKNYKVESKCKSNVHASRCWRLCVNGYL